MIGIGGAQSQLHKELAEECAVAVVLVGITSRRERDVALLLALRRGDVASEEGVCDIQDSLLG